MTLILVDSSAWIDSFSKKPSPMIVERILSARKTKGLATCGLVYLEVVRGSRSEVEYKELHEEFHALKWFHTEEEDWELACKMGLDLSKKGLRPPSTDLFIATLAIRHGSCLLHCDKHFPQIARYFPLKEA